MKDSVSNRAERTLGNNASRLFKVGSVSTALAILAGTVGEHIGIPATEIITYVTVGLGAVALGASVAGAEINHSYELPPRSDGSFVYKK